MFIANHNNTKFIALVDLPHGISHPYISPKSYKFNSTFGARAAIANYATFNPTDSEKYEIKNGFMVYDLSGRYADGIHCETLAQAQDEKEQWEQTIHDSLDDDWDYMIRIIEL